MSYEQDADWSFRGDYMMTRHRVSPGEANEALSDLSRLVIIPDPSSLSGRGIRVIGKTPTGRVLTVIVMDVAGVRYGVNGWPSNYTDRRRYKNQGSDHEG